MLLADFAFQSNSQRIFLVIPGDLLTLNLWTVLCRLLFDNVPVRQGGGLQVLDSFLFGDVVAATAQGVVHGL